MAEPREVCGGRIGGGVIVDAHERHAVQARLVDANQRQPVSQHGLGGGLSLGIEKTQNASTTASQTAGALAAPGWPGSSTRPAPCCSQPSAMPLDEGDGVRVEQRVRDRLGEQQPEHARPVPPRRRRRPSGSGPP